jgi:hypothetical protein
MLLLAKCKQTRLAEHITRITRSFQGRLPSHWRSSGRAMALLPNQSFHWLNSKQLLFRPCSASGEAFPSNFHSCSGRSALTPACSKWIPPGRNDNDNLSRSERLKQVTKIFKLNLFKQFRNPCIIHKDDMNLKTFCLQSV